jgi:hypothetical protein
MGKTFQYLICLIALIGLAEFVYTLFGNSNLRAIQKDLERANRSADSAIIEVKNAKTKIDSVRLDIKVMQNYVANVQKFVALNDAQKNANAATTAKAIKANQAKIDSLRNEIRMDSLPPITERYLKKHP